MPSRTPDIPVELCEPRPLSLIAAELDGLRPDWTLVDIGHRASAAWSTTNDEGSCGELWMIDTARVYGG